jgi:hypothetical protein
MPLRHALAGTIQLSAGPGLNSALEDLIHREYRIEWLAATSHVLRAGWEWI